jgi:hypothetical protein
MFFFESKLMEIVSSWSCWKCSSSNRNSWKLSVRGRVGNVLLRIETHGNCQFVVVLEMFFFESKLVRNCQFVVVLEMFFFESKLTEIVSSWSCWKRSSSNRNSWKLSVRGRVGNVLLRIETREKLSVRGRVGNVLLRIETHGNCQFVVVLETFFFESKLVRNCPD